MTRPALYHSVYWGLRLAADDDWPALRSVTVKAPSGPPEVYLATRPAPLADGPSGVALRPQAARLHIQGVARYTVRGGHTIAVTPVAGAAPRAVQLYLLGSAWGALCYQRGLLPLHASAVQVGDGAVAFSGPTGAGKSSLVAALTQHGYALLSDDLCRCDLDPDGQARLWPSQPRLKLWDTALTALGAPAAGLEQDLVSEAKFHLPTPTADPAVPRPLRAFYLLEWGPAACERLTGLAAVRALVATASYRAGLLPTPRHLADHWRALAELARRVPIYRLSRPQSWAGLDATLAQLDLHGSREYFSLGSKTPGPAGSALGSGLG